MSAHSIPEPPVSFALPKVSVREYLSRERLSEKRHEYVDGEIIAMSGETPAHNQIAGNLYRNLGNRFEERPCEIYFENVKARVTPTQYRYPDVMALRGEAHFDAEHPPSLLNPSVIVEVLSPATESFDRNGKFMDYRLIAALTDYILIAQDQLSVMHYVRQSLTQWTVTEYTALDDIITFDSLEVSVSLADIYRKVVFVSPPEPTAI